MKKKLEVTIKTNLTSYLNYSLPISAISDEIFKKWSLEHFGNIYFMHNRRDFVWIDYLEKVKFYDDVLDNELHTSKQMRCSINNINDFKNYIVDTINNDQYIMLFIDEYYVKGRFNYHNKHEMKQFMISGYDTDTNEGYVICFTNNGIMGETTYNLDELGLGYLKCLHSNDIRKKWIDDYNLITLKPKIKENYCIDDKKVIKQISDFYNSCGCVDDLRKEIREERGLKAIYGIKAQNKYINEFYKLIHNLFTVHYVTFHMLIEQKGLMLEKIQYLANQKHIDSEYIEEYKNIYSTYNKIRMLYVKCKIRM